MKCPCCYREFDPQVKHLRVPHWYSNRNVHHENYMALAGFTFPEQLDTHLYKVVDWITAGEIRELAQDIFDGKKKFNLNLIKGKPDHYREAVLHAVFMRKAKS